MIAFLIYSKDRFYQNLQSIKIYENFFKEKNIKLFVLIENDLKIEILDNVFKLTYQNQTLPEPNFVINRTNNFNLAKVFEMQNIKVFNSSLVCLLANDKRLTVILANSLGIKVANCQLYGKIDKTQLNENSVLKPFDGSGGKDVRIAQKYGEILSHDILCERLENTSDTRVYVIGGKIVTAIKRSATNGICSNFKQGGKIEIVKLTNEQIEVVNKLCSKIKFDFVGIDLMQKGNEVLLNEIEDSVGARMVYKLTNFDIISDYCRYILNSI